MTKFLIILFFLISPLARAGSVCREYFEENNKAFKIRKEKVSIEYSFKLYGKYDKTREITWSNRYSNFINWQKCDSAYLDGSVRLGKYYCNGKLLFEIDEDWRRNYHFDWYDSNDNLWSTYTSGNEKEGYANTPSWISTKCIIRDGYYTDSRTTLYPQYNKKLDQHWAALVEIRKFYEIIIPQF